MLAAYPPPPASSSSSPLLSSPAPFPAHGARPAPAGLVTAAGDGAADDNDDDEEEEEQEDIDELLFGASLDLISHKPFLAVQKLQQAVNLRSSAACVELAKLVTRIEATPLNDVPISISPPASSAGAHPLRPAPPVRQDSNVYAHAAHSHRKSAEMLRAAGLYLRGLELELAKPVKDQKGKGRASDALDSGYGEGSDEEDGTEGRFFSLERALDLVVGLTDSHRFGVLHAPTPSTYQGAVDEQDELWTRSATVTKELLDHRLVAPILVAEPPSPFVDVTATPEDIVRRSSRRRLSTSRSFSRRSAHSASNSSLLASTSKLQLTIAIHALYTLALQAHSSTSSLCCGPSLPSPPSDDAESHWTTITRLAAPYAAHGGVGTKEGDELVSRAQHRLDSLRRQDLGANEPWRLAKLVKREAPPPPPVSKLERGAIWEGESASVVTIRGAAVSSSVGTIRGSFGAGGETPRAAPSAKLQFRSVEEDVPEEAAVDEEEPFVDEADGDADGSAFALSMPKESPFASFCALNSSVLTAAGRLAASQQYPSPPETPPLDPAAQLFDFRAHSRGGSPPASSRGATSPSRRPSPPAGLSPSAAATPLFIPVPSLSSPASASPGSNLLRAPSLRSFTSYRSTTSVLSSFSHNPLEAYTSGHGSRRGLRRIVSSASVCTAPPNFQRRASRSSALSRSQSSAATAPELEEVDPSAARTTGSKLADLLAPSLPRAGDTASEWVSRLWSSTKDVVEELKVVAAAQVGELEKAVERSRRPNAARELRRALAKHEEAVEASLIDWGDEGEEIEEGIDNSQSSAPEATSSSPVPPSSAAQLRPPPLARHDTPTTTASSKRSFLLEDPTSRPASPTSLSARRRAHHRSPSASSVSSYTPPIVHGHLAPPPSSSGRRKRRGSRSHSRSGSVASVASASSASLAAPRDVGMDPFLAELERRSPVGVATTCAACSKAGLNFSACTSCEATYCSRECRTSAGHECRKARRA
ncbi:hypothetical protein JCM6882_004069 [Rhodosporidiobolus microsporus]